MYRMLKSWLEHKEIVPCPYDKFSLMRIDERQKITDQIIEYLGKLIINSHGHPQKIQDDIQMLQEDTKELGLSIIENYIKSKVLPSNRTTQIGNFGEIIAMKCMVELENYTSPIYKLRYREKRNWAMRLTDIFLLKKEKQGSLSVCYGEVKTRSERRYTTSIRKVAVDAFESLKKDDALQDPEILGFIRNRLYDQDRNDEALLLGKIELKKIKYETNYVLFLVHDTHIWKDEILDELENHPSVDGLRLSVKVLRISNLRDLIDFAYNTAWKGVIATDG